MCIGTEGVKVSPVNLHRRFGRAGGLKECEGCNWDLSFSSRGAKHSADLFADVLSLSVNSQNQSSKRLWSECHALTLSFFIIINA